MSRLDAARYIAAETAASIVVNVAMSVVPAALSAGGQGTPGNASGLAGAVLPLFMGAFMSALVPSLLTHRRQLGGKRRDLLGCGRPAVMGIIAVSLLLAAASAALGVLLAGAVPALTGGKGLTGATLLFKGVYGGLAAALVTPSALLLLFWRADVWRVPFGHGWRNSHG